MSEYPAACEVTDDFIFVASDGMTTKTVSVGKLKSHLSAEIQLLATEAAQYDLAGAVIEFYKKILETPLSADMLQEWERLSSFVRAVEEMAGKYVPLVEAEITSKIEGP
jgi:hypothetical protein